MIQKFDNFLNEAVSSKIEGSKIIGWRFVSFYELANESKLDKESNEYKKLQYITGYLLSLSNGNKLVIGGGSKSSMDFCSMYLIDKNFNVIGEWEDDI